MDVPGLDGYRAVVITVSDRSASGEREDRSGPLLVRLLAEAGLAVSGPGLVPDDMAAVTAALRAAVADGVDLVVTTGGTGLGPRDITPEATLAVIDRRVPGLAEALRADPRSAVPTSLLSRGVCGLAGRTLVVNLAGSTGAVRDGVATLAPVLPHALVQLDGADH